MIEQKEGFLLYKGFYEPIKHLSNEHKGLLIDAIFQYQISGSEPETTSPIKMAFEFFKNQFRIDDGKYEKIVARNRENGKKGGRPKNETQDNPKNPSGFKKTQKTQVDLKKPKKADKDKDKDKDTDKEILPVSGSSIENPKPKSYGNKSINEIIEYLTEDGASLDGSTRSNRFQAHNLLRKLKKLYPDKTEEDIIAGVKMVIDVAREDEFHSRNLTSVKYLYNNFQKIINLTKETNLTVVKV